MEGTRTSNTPISKILYPGGEDRCFICLKEDHLAKECKLQSNVCIHCGEKKKHHRSLLSKIFRTTKKPGIVRNGSDKKINSTQRQPCGSWRENSYVNCT